MEAGTQVISETEVSVSEQVDEANDVSSSKDETETGDVSNIEAPSSDDTSNGQGVVSETVSDEEAALNDNLMRCEAKIEFSGEVASGESFGPSIEEARENAIEEACAVPCAERLSDSAKESEREDMHEACLEKCALEEAIIIAAQCWLKGESIYVEGAWSSDDEAVATED